MITLEMWLTQATRCLASQSTAQVRTEIQEHYESARDASMMGGATSEEADRLALSALGDAKAANRQYRRVLLTSSEAKTLRDLNCEALPLCSRPWLKWLMVAVPVFAVIMATTLWFRGQEAARDVLIVGLGLSPLLAAPLLPIYTPSRAQIFRCVKWVFMTGMFVLFFQKDTLKLSWLMISCLWPMAWSEWTRASIRRKLPVSAWPKHLYL